MPFLYLVCLHCKAILVLFPNMEIIKGSKQINHDGRQWRNQNLSSVSGPFTFSRETWVHVYKSNVLREIAPETDHEQWAGELVLPCCLSCPVSTDCLIREKKKKSISLPLMFLCFQGQPHTGLTVVCNSTREWFWYKTWGAYIQLKLELPFIDLAQNIRDICQKCHRGCSNYRQHLESYWKKSPRCAVRREIKEDESPPWEEAVSCSAALLPTPWFSQHS